MPQDRNITALKAHIQRSTPRTVGATRPADGIALSVAGSGGCIRVRMGFGISGPAPTTYVSFASGWCRVSHSPGLQLCCPPCEKKCVFVVCVCVCVCVCVFQTALKGTQAEGGAGGGSNGLSHFFLFLTNAVTQTCQILTKQAGWI
jgi:hypothetical protein